MKHLLYSIILMGFLLSCGTENKPTYKVTTTVSPTEGGTITLNPSGGVYSGGETVTITGTPSTGWRFLRWEGDWSGETNPSTLNMTKDYSVIGIFVKRDYPLTINVEGEGTVVERVIQQKTTQYPYQTVVELTPVPSEGWRFVQWSGDLSGSEVPKTITVDGEKTVNVKFERKNYPLTITIVGEGTVEETIVPQKTTEYPYETVVELTPIPSEGWEFVEWGGDLTGSEVPKQITVDTEKQVTVTFQLKTYPLNVSVEGNGTINVEPLLDLYPHGSQVTLTPVPERGWKLSQWSGDGSGTTIPLVVTVTSETSITGTLIPIVYLSENGITIMCPNGKVGEIGVIDGVEYEVVDRNLLNQRRDEGKDLTKVCVSLVTNMNSLFNNSSFNQPIGNWDVSNVTDMGGMFNETPFNQPIGNWDVSNVRSMRLMFRSTPFNQPIGDWNVGNVTNMDFMFQFSNFNHPIGEWDVSNVTRMIRMFESSPFNHPIGNWDVSSVRDMNSMFNETPFNQPIGDWDVSNVTDMGGMFNETPFNQPIGNWDVSNVRSMRLMFRSTPFNQPIGDWKVSSVTSMDEMFQFSNFNHPIGEWDVSNVTRMIRMFESSPFNHPIRNWDVSSVRDMNSMFNNSQFNQPINKWCVTKIPSEPDRFSTNSPLTPQNKPIWGRCPTR
jgi:surface protein